MKFTNVVAAIMVVVGAMATAAAFAPTTKAAAIEATPWYTPLVMTPTATNQLSAMAGGNPVWEYYTSDRSINLYGANQLVNVGAECLNGGKPLIVTMTKSPARRVETVGYDEVLLPEYIARVDIGTNMAGIGQDGSRYDISVNDSFLAQYTPNGFSFAATITVTGPNGSFRQSIAWSKFVDPATAGANINEPKLERPSCDLGPKKMPAADKGD